MERDDLHFFDRAADWDVFTRALPHWSQAGAVTFVTWRLADSLPSSARRRMDREIDSLLADEGLNSCHDWRGRVDELSPRRRSVLQFKMFQIRDKFLDEGFGCCCLSSSELAEIVLESLRRFDGERYILTDAVVMPNHVHFLCSFSSATQMLKQCNEWKRFTARQINRRIGQQGERWQVDQFDHLVRSLEQFEYLRRYIADNPRKAGIDAGAACYYQLQL